MDNIYEKTIDIGDGREITIQTGKLARQADGAVVVRMGDTMLLATVVSAKEIKEDTDFLPLTCEYREKFSSVGRFPGGFIKRESKPSDYEILVSRLIDRALRPLFPENYYAETFVNVTLISSDKNVMPDSLAGLAASAALTVSDIPFHGPISEVRVARINGEFKINPNFVENENADIDIIIGATKDNIIMVEGQMNEVSEDDLLQALKFAHKTIKKQCEIQIQLAKELNIQKRKYEHQELEDELKKQIYDFCYKKIYKLAKSHLPTKRERHSALDKILNELLETLSQEQLEKEKLIIKYFKEIERQVLRELILKKKIRIDGRELEEIRAISCEIDCLPTVHGSALFTRGETQALATVTLGTKLDEQTIDEALITGSERFLLHYNFPPFSTGDARPQRGPTRREIGHGNLAYRALSRMIPKDREINPYTIRVVSDILESNGSSSMATVCAATLALMDAGIKIKEPVSGIAMGLVIEDNKNYAILTDILGDEDHCGDMDFKIAGTRNGITACQMDIKIEGLSYEILAKALEQAKKGRLFILDLMTQIISKPRDSFKPNAPKILTFKIPAEMISAVIGSEGKIIQNIERKTNTSIFIEKLDNIGIVEVTASTQENLIEAQKLILDITTLPKIGEVYEGKVTAITHFGAFIEFMPGKHGLLHISEIDWKHITRIEDFLKEGEIIKVKLIDIDKDGKFKLSRKALINKPQTKKNYRRPPYST